MIINEKKMIMNGKKTIGNEKMIMDEKNDYE